MATTSFIDAVTQSSAAWAQDVDTATYSSLTAVAGTNTITAGGPKSFTLAVGQRFVFIPAATNTGATTLNITPSGGSALGAKDIFARGAACVGNEIVSGIPCLVVYDGTRFSLLNAMASSGTWTPVLTFSTPGNLSVAYTTQMGQWSRVGDLMYVWWSIVTSTFTHSTASGNLSITGVPVGFKNVANYFPIGSFSWGGITKAGYTQITPFGLPNDTQMQFDASGSAVSPANITSADLPTGGTIKLIGSIMFKPFVT